MSLELGPSLVAQAVFVASVIFLLYRFLVHTLLASPLAAIPAAHWSCHLSSAWVLLARKNRRENNFLHEAHRKLGPVVRVGPNDVSVDGFEGLRVVYQGGFEKDPWYEVFSNYGTPNMFSTLASKPHSLRKRAVSHVYSKSYILASEALRRQTALVLFNRLLPLLAQASSRPGLPHSPSPRDPGSEAGLDVFPLLLASSMDLISAYVFGVAGGTDFLGDETYRSHWLALYLARGSHTFWPQEFPRLTRFCHDWLGLRLYPWRIDRANEELSAWNWQMCEAAKEARTKHMRGPGAYGTGKGGRECECGWAEKGEKQCIGPCGQEHDHATQRRPEDEAVVFEALHAGKDEQARKHGPAWAESSDRDRDRAVASEVMDHLLAGHETSGIALAYAVWHLSRSPRLQDELRAELSPVMQPSTARIVVPQGDAGKATEHGVSIGLGIEKIPDLPDPKTIDALPLLHAVMMETLRLHAPIPGPEPRRTPLHEGCRIAGFRVPGGVRIAALAYTLHRDEGVFPDAGNWEPERWLSRDGTEEKKDAGNGEGEVTAKQGGKGEEEERIADRKRAMQKRFWAFGSGGRMCIGSNFAMNSMKYTLAAIYTNFKTFAVEEKNDGDMMMMEQVDAYTARPVGERLVVRLEPVSEPPSKV